MRRQISRLLAGILTFATLGLGPAARGAPYQAPTEGGTAPIVVPLEANRAPTGGPATDSLRDYLAGPLRLDGRQIAPEGLPGAPAAHPLEITPKLVAEPWPTELQSFDPGTASLLEVPSGTDLARSEFSASAPSPAPDLDARRAPSTGRHRDLRIPEPASLILLLTGVVGLTARRHLNRNRA